MLRWTAKNSMKPMTNMTEVSLMLMMKLLPIWGMMLRKAWGRITWTMVWTVGHADGLGTLGLAGVHGDDAAADGLGHISAGVDGHDDDAKPSKRRYCP